jgi:hypothetical protein
MSPILREVSQHGLKLQNHVSFVDQGDLVADLRSHKIARPTEVGYHRYRTQGECLEDHPSANFP